MTRTARFEDFLSRAFLFQRDRTNVYPEQFSLPPVAIPAMFIGRCESIFVVERTHGNSADDPGMDSSASSPSVRAIAFEESGHERVNHGALQARTLRQTTSTSRAAGDKGQSAADASTDCLAFP